MGKFVLIFLLCAFVAICRADEVQKETEKPALDALETALQERLNQIKKFVSDNIDPNKINDILSKVAEHTKTFVESTQKDLQTINEKKA